MQKLPLLLLILDGWGHRQETDNNAIALANTPVWDNLWQHNPHTLLSASGNDVGLPDGQMGNSEVGHLTIGSGRVIYQDLTKINLAIKSGSFYTNHTLIGFMQATKQKAKALHIMGLLSPGGVHAHEEHFFAVLQLCKKLQLSQVYIHVFLDGRDMPPTSAKASLEALQQHCTNLNIGNIASVTGRFYAMDRDQRIERTQSIYDLLMSGKAAYTAASALEALEQAYSRGETDEFVKPTKIINNFQNIENEDSVLFMNFRADRARQLCYALTKQNTNVVVDQNKTIHLMTMTEYASDLAATIVFPKDSLQNTLGDCLQQHKLSQLRIAETEKYAHVTFFFNGGSDQPFAHEQRLLIPSPKVATYDNNPEMSSFVITEELIKIIQQKTYDVIICNFANADMIGHTGNLTAAIAAIEAIDLCLGKIITAITAVDGEMMITADHGNAEQMFDEHSAQPHTAHTTSLVPLIYVGKRKLKFNSSVATLANVAPSMLALLGLTIPPEMTGKSLINFN